MIMVISILAMVGAAIVNVCLTESKDYCNESNQSTYACMTVTGSTLMFLGWIMLSQSGNFKVSWMHAIAILYMAVFFFDVLEAFRLTGERDGDQRRICEELKKSAVTTSVGYFIFSYLIS